MTRFFSARRSILATVAVGAVGSGIIVNACRDGHVSASDCTAMLNRYIDMTIASDPAIAKLPEASARVAREMKAAVKRAEKSYRRVQDQCETEVTRHEYRCAMGAHSPNEWEACID